MNQRRNTRSFRTPGSLRYTRPKPRLFLDRLISQVKHDAKSTTEEAWFLAAVATFGELKRHRRQHRAELRPA